MNITFAQRIALRYHRTRLMLRRLLSLLVPLAALALVGCTPGARSTAGGLLTTLGPDVPVLCNVIPGANGQICSTTTAAISDVAKLIGDILAGLPKGARADLDVTPMTRAINGCLVTLPAWQMAAVLAKLPRS